VAAEAALPYARVSAVPARIVLGAIVALGFGARWLLATLHVPHMFPDEYIYSALAQGLAETGLPQIRGEVAAFPALLEPLLAAPFWLAGDPELAYRLTQGLHALAVSLAALPAYALSRHLGLGTRASLLLSALAIAWPAAGWSAYVLADPIAYPVVLAAVWAIVRTLEAPSVRGQALVLALSGLSALARAQYLVLPLVFVGAALVLERGRIRAYWPTLAVVGAAAGIVGAIGLGYYDAVFGLGLDPVELGRWGARDLLVLGYAAGWLIVPGALVGLVSTKRRAFSVTTVLLGACLLGQAALYESNSAAHLARVHERYFFVLLPLLAIAFALCASRWTAIALLAAGALAAVAVFPLSGYTVGQGAADSPTLRAVYHVQAAIGIDDGALAAAALAGLLAAAAVALRGRTVPALGVTIAVALLVNVGAYAYERRAAKGFDTIAAGDSDWIDDLGLERVALLELKGSDRIRAFEQLFWNRSIGEVLTLGGQEIDKFPHRAVAVQRDGSLTGAPRVLVVNEWGSRALFAGATRTEKGFAVSLVRSAGPPRLRLLAEGLFADGWLAAAGEITVWSPGTLRLVLSRGPRDDVVPVSLRAPGYSRTVEVRGRVNIEVPVRGTRPWRLTWSTPQPAWIGGGRQVSVLAEMPVLTANR
jgi:hypothetical protein